jgi:hypothetical protein
MIVILVKDNTRYNVFLSAVMLSVVMLSVVAPMNTVAKIYMFIIPTTLY